MNGLDTELSRALAAASTTRDVTIASGSLGLLPAVLRRTARELGSPRVDVAENLERAAIEALREAHPDRPLETNVEFWAAVVLEIAKIPPPMYPAMFGCARVAGWSAHILEQQRTGRLIRPSAVYTGPAERAASDVDGWDDAWT